MVDVDVRIIEIRTYVKDELAWTVDKRLQVINTMYNVIIKKQ